MTNLNRRLSLLGWTPESRTRIQAFRPTLQANIDRILRRLYDHLLRHNECAQLFAKTDINSRLVPAQRAHWIRLFQCEFDETFVLNAIRIGQVHYHRRIPPYIYIASYNYFLGEVLAVSTEAVRGLDLPHLLADISRLVSLDMELSLSAYVRQHWADDILTNVVLVN